MSSSGGVASSRFCTPSTEKGLVARSSAGQAFDVIVNFQADEPFLPPGHVAEAIGPVAQRTADIATLATPFRSDEEWNYSLMEGAKGVQLADLGLESWQGRKWVDVPELE